MVKEAIPDHQVDFHQMTKEVVVTDLVGLLVTMVTQIADLLGGILEKDAKAVILMIGARVAILEKDVKVVTLAQDAKGAILDQEVKVDTLAQDVRVDTLAEIEEMAIHKISLTKR